MLKLVDETGKVYFGNKDSFTESCKCLYTPIHITQRTGT